jgi:hypothetical protein
MRGEILAFYLNKEMFSQAASQMVHLSLSLRTILPFVESGTPVPSHSPSIWLHPTQIAIALN